MPGLVGQSVRRVEDRRFLTDAGRYGADVKLPNQAHAVFVRSPHAHATLSGIDRRAAMAAEGVLAVLTGADLRAAGIGPIPSFNNEPPYLVRNDDGSAIPDAAQHPLVEDRARFAGQPVAAVVAESLAQARDAAELVEVDLEPLPAVTSIAAALAPEAPTLWPEAPSNRTLEWAAGDRAATDAAFADAAHLVELTVAFPRACPAFMEPRAAVARHDPGSGRFTLHAGCQSAHRLRGVLAKVLGLDDAEIQVVVPDTGGGFGARGIVYPEFVVALHAARLLGQPVKWVAERGESFLTDTQARSQEISGTLALDAEGRFLGLRVAATWCHGAYFGPRAAFVLTGAMSTMICGTYRVPCSDFALTGVTANTAPIGSYRAVARTEANYLLERLIDLAARSCGFDPIALRRRNMIARAEMPWASPAGAVYPPADFGAALDKGLAAVGHDALAARKTGSAAHGLLRGFGIAPFVISAGGEPSESAALALAEVATKAARRDTPLSAHEAFDTAAPAYPSGCHLCEVDPETGRVRLDRMVSVVDPGRIINPLLVDGQIHGGVAEGIGEAQIERVVYDEASGQLLTGSFMEFALPRAADLPSLETVLDAVCLSITVATPPATNPFGSRRRSRRRPRATPLSFTPKARWSPSTTHGST